MSISLEKETHGVPRIVSSSSLRTEKAVYYAILMHLLGGFKPSPTYQSSQPIFPSMVDHTININKYFKYLKASILTVLTIHWTIEPSIPIHAVL